MIRRIWWWCCFFFQAEDGIRDLVRSRGLGDVYKRQEDQRDLRVEGILFLLQEVVEQPHVGAAAAEEMRLSLIHI